MNIISHTTGNHKWRITGQYLIGGQSDKRCKNFRCVYCGITAKNYGSKTSLFINERIEASEVFRCAKAPKMIRKKKPVKMTRGKPKMIRRKKKMVRKPI